MRSVVMIMTAAIVVVAAAHHRGAAASFAGRWVIAPGPLSRTQSGGRLTTERKARAGRT